MSSRHHKYIPRGKWNLFLAWIWGSVTHTVVISNSVRPDSVILLLLGSICWFKNGLNELFWAISFIVLLYFCTLFIVSVTIYCILFEYCGQVRKLAASRDIACVDCDGKGGSNVKQCQVNVENERERKRERELFRIYTLL